MYIFRPPPPTYQEEPQRSTVTLAWTGNGHRDPHWQSSGTRRATFLSDSLLGTGALTNGLGAAAVRIAPVGSARGSIPTRLALFCGPHKPGRPPHPVDYLGPGSARDSIASLHFGRSPRLPLCWDAAPKAPCVNYDTHKGSESSACVLAQTQTPRRYTRRIGTDSDAPGT